jgi:hypothetical protein
MHGVGIIRVQPVHGASGSTRATTYGYILLLSCAQFTRDGVLHGAWDERRTDSSYDFVQNKVQAIHGYPMVR